MQWVKYLWNLKDKTHKFLNPMKEGANRKNYGSTVIRKAWGVQKSLYHVSTPKKTKDTDVCLRCVGWVVCEDFSSQVFAFTLVIGITRKKKLTQQWILLFMEKLIVQISSWLRIEFVNCDCLFKRLSVFSHIVTVQINFFCYHHFVGL